MATAIEREGIREAYTEVMSDNNGIEWWVNQLAYVVFTGEAAYEK